MQNFRNREDVHKFEYEVEGSVAFADYRLEGSTLYIDYVEAPQALRGTGAVGQLMQHIMQTAKNKQWHVVPICGYAASWISRHDAS